eukprot:Tbor_TRINITY_DN5473_c1_g1::TRINITY_DN5473_c1_g1_i1::g.25406::m.25406/K00326/E1.6.2.2; cytochrome-b5 reductase
MPFWRYTSLGFAGACVTRAFLFFSSNNDVAECYSSTEVREYEAKQRRLKEDITMRRDSEQGPMSEKEIQKLRGQPFSARFKPYQLGEIVPITHDVALFRFLLSDTDDAFNLRPCSTLQACVKYGVQPAEQFQRFYTPVTSNNTKGYFDIIVKRKPGGMMTNHLFGMHVGDKMLFRCIGLKIRYKPNRWKHVGMIAGGTGFTPMLQVIRASLEGEGSEEDKTKLSFLFCNRTEKHILLKGLFDDLMQKYHDRFKVSYCIDKAVSPKDWDGYTGYVTKEMIEKTLPLPTEDNYIIMLCGPDQLLNHVAGTPMHSMAHLSKSMNQQPMAADMNNLVRLGGVLGSMGYDNNLVYRF